jgi:hypothetical protein
MELTLTLIIACAAIWIVWLSIRGREIVISSTEDFERKLREVDVSAIQNLMSPSEDAFLRRMLAAADYREVERARIRAMLDYVKAIAWNAALFMRAADVLRRSLRPEVAASAAAISKQALDLRLLSLTAQCALYVRLVLPSANISPRGIATIYAEVRSSLADARRLEGSLRAA